MLPVIAIVGRPNVGKSTLFNRLTKSNDALVVDMPGVTRDRQYGYCHFNQQRLVLIDTGGMQENTDVLHTQVSNQAKLAIDESDALIFLLDAREGLHVGDHAIATVIRQSHKPVYLCINKTDGLDASSACIDFHQLGMGEPMPIAASHGRGVTPLLTMIMGDHEADSSEATAACDDRSAISIALIGKPNVGKSTLTNRLLGEERMLVSDIPGTTRDSISHSLTHADQPYRLVDTAGIRRRSKVHEKLEIFSVIKTLQAIDACHVVLFLIDSRAGLADLDLKLLGHVLKSGKALVIALNKWDGLPDDTKQDLHTAIDRQLAFVDFAVIHRISALHGSGVNDLFKSINQAFAAATCDLATAEITTVLQRLVEKHPPPIVNSRRIKLRYVHLGGHIPPIFVIHGSQAEKVPKTYQRYLINGFRKHFNLYGTAIRLHFKSGENPFAGKKNVLTPRQLKKRQRIRGMSKHKK